MTIIYEVVQEVPSIVDERKDYVRRIDVEIVRLVKEIYLKYKYVNIVKKED